MIKRTLLLLAAAVYLAACASLAPVYQAGTPCEASSFTVVDDFAGARRGSCAVLGSEHVRLRILPEDDGFINDSAWYAFRVQPKTPTAVTVTLQYSGGHHRYVPKTSDDGLNWIPIDESRVSISADGTEATFTLQDANVPVWIAGQEIITPAMYSIWNRKMEKHAEVELRPLGKSINGVTIEALSVNPDAKNVLMIIGRQHPPEVSGAFAFLSFFETLAGETDLAREFRSRFGIIAVPLLNPDGVLGGNWRHNLGGTDLNRDWGPFEQPETRLMNKLLTELGESDRDLRVFLDFHSTQRNLFYTQDQERITEPEGFTATWLENARLRVQDYSFTNEEGTAEKEGVAKNYIYHRYGIPTATYEVGDETNREATRQAAVVFAEELMKLMLEQID